MQPTENNMQAASRPDAARRLLAVGWIGCGVVWDDVFVERLLN